ncbi:capsular biosynthesis protein [Oleomonas cavernae]|uniref:Capsular biosynthesis protein n=1 Tax=Oleomonas cavernae TaxID=2320859 RepID=A0A418WTB4_9PROT|nr:capsular biosynthesis protein [Oleomonas cavernae]RJF94501.1 capsular biosynthesis protein [Oleomonas cavernae]
MGVPLPATVSPIDGDRPARARCFLFLQGPIGPFFRRLGLALAARGHRIVRVNFNGGDTYDWPWPSARLFRGANDEFPAWVGALAKAHDVTDLVLLGDCRPLHVAAVETLKQWRPALLVHVFEEGYLRPDNITLELDGVNARSSLPRDPAAILESPEAAADLILSHPVRPQNIVMGRRTLASYSWLFLLGWLFQRYRHHRENGPAFELWTWFKRLAGRPARLAEVARREKQLLASGAPYYLALMQLNTDKQLLFHSPFKSIHEFLIQTVQSFAVHAPKDTLLVVKGHPLDNGQTPHDRQLNELAAHWGVAERIVYLDGGNLSELLGACRGAITINSTAGISALHRSLPLVVLGRAIYDLPGLTHRRGLDSFWTDPDLPQRDLYLAWRQVVAARTQVNGGFYTNQGMALAMPKVIERLEAAPAAAALLAAPGTEASYEAPAQALAGS